MKLMTYNIFDGAVQTLDKVREVVQQQSPDYLTINEANTFSDNNNKILKEFAKAINLPYFDIALSGEFNYHVAVFSKYPFKTVDKLQPLARACLITLINTPLGEVSIASLHLTPYSEDLRHPEIDTIITFQKQFPQRILMGDMNSLSASDNYDASMINQFNEAQLKKFTTNKQFRFDAIDKILSVGYYDVAVEQGKNKETTVPTPTNTDTTHASLRLDYIFVSKPLLPHVTDYTVVKNSLTDHASDHYPIIATLI